MKKGLKSATLDLMINYFMISIITMKKRMNVIYLYNGWAESRSFMRKIFMNFYVSA
jgi:hypothetical protein